MVADISPVMLKSPSNPLGTPIEVFDTIRKGIVDDRAQFFADLSSPFYGANRLDSNVSQGLRDFFVTQSMMAGMPACYFCVKAFSETDLTGDLRKFDVPAIFIHGSDDQVVPLAASALISSKIVKGSVLKVYEGAPHGLPSTLKDRLNTDLLEFVRSLRRSASLAS
jgi:non-heme chloroperoxidase